MIKASIFLRPARLPQKLARGPHRAWRPGVSMPAQRLSIHTTLAPKESNGNGSQGLEHDINVLRDAARRNPIPRESYVLGLCGTIPYFATSLSTVYLAWDLTREPSGHAMLVDHHTAQSLLGIIEPLQLGYGAVIISFLGAIHWGLEYAERQPDHDRTRFRYGMGLASSIVAWPTLLMPVEYALITQFMAFMTLYYADSRATARGWAPSWYSKYRFLLTAMVGMAIFVSLVGRAKIAQTTGMRRRMERSRVEYADHTTDWAKLEEEDRQRQQREQEKQKRELAEEEEEKKKKTERVKEKGRDAQTDSGDDRENDGMEKDDATDAQGGQE